MAGAYTKWEKNGIRKTWTGSINCFLGSKTVPASMPGLSQEESGRCWLLGGH